MTWYGVVTVWYGHDITGRQQEEASNQRCTCSPLRSVQFSPVQTYDARVYLVWTLLGIIFFLPSLCSKFSTGGTQPTLSHHLVLHPSSFFFSMQTAVLLLSTCMVRYGMVEVCEGAPMAVSGMVWYGMVEVCEGAPVAVSGWVLTMYQHYI